MSFFKMNSRIANYLPGFIIFCLSIILSLSVYKDYGITWDEKIQREMGLVSYEYIVDNNPFLESYLEKDHGTGFEVPLIALERMLNLTEMSDIFLMRHLVTNLFFLCCCFCGYILSYRLFRSKLIASLGFLMFAFHPRLYAHSYFNSKDLPFMGMFLVSLTLCQLAFDKDRKVWYLLAGLAIGYTTSIRILGVMLACMVSVFLIVDIITSFKKKRTLTSVIKFFLLTGGFCIGLYAAFPTLWKTPVASFLEVFDSLSHFRWIAHVLFNGDFVLSTELPWTYLPTWFGITTPVLWLMAGLAGLVLVVTDAIKSPLSFLTNTRNRNFLLYAACFTLPVVMIIALHSIVYDDWRHVYFIYPPFVLLGLYAIDRFRLGKGKYIVPGLIVLQFACIGYFMVRYHPHQQVYFNELVSHKPEALRKQYELDYWGASYKQGVEYLLAYDTSAKIKVTSNHSEVLGYQGLIMPASDWQRIEIAPLEEAKYFIGNYRWQREDFPYTNVLHKEQVLNSTIMAIYKLK